jgi:hypothetical protein
LTLLLATLTPGDSAKKGRLDCRSKAASCLSIHVRHTVGPDVAGKMLCVFTVAAMLATMTMSTEANAGTDDRDFAIPLTLGPVGSQKNVTFSVTPGNTVAGSVSFFALPCLMGNAGGFRSSQIE